MQKYFGQWSTASNLIDSFESPDVATDAEILLASYECEGYEGDAFVLFVRGGKLYEVHGSHCSCYGLEGQWEPEETTAAAIMMRPKPLHYHSAEAQAALARVLGGLASSETTPVAS